ncbi:MAG: twin-arginine translocation signal domain-containing protein, partial [Planctomycetales bacterium]|nr:twin-arginine translocation signal domain-containing protein [Planctomycetales bacterium]
MNIESQQASRRQFLKTSTSLAAAGAALTVPTNVHAAVDETIKVGLIGCGGRGTGAAAQALKADKQARLVAMGDAFEDRLQLSLGSLSRQ